MGTRYPVCRITNQQLKADGSGGADVDAVGSQSLAESGKYVGEELLGHVRGEGGDAAAGFLAHGDFVAQKQGQEAEAKSDAGRNEEFEVCEERRHVQMLA